MTRRDTPRLIALDWGTSTLRAWLLDGRGRVLDSARAPMGIMQVERREFADALDAVTAGWPQRLQAIASGMIGSTRGWVEAPYLSCPVSLGDLASALVPVPGGRLWIVPGVIRTSDVPDVMRGEETQIAGAVALRSDLGRGARFVLPGTHCKWVDVSDGHIETFATYMTGELFAVLRDHSILSGPAREATPDASATGGSAAFLRGVDAARRGDGIAPLLFSVRALEVTGGLTSGESLEYLSGLLIGDEIRSALAEPAGMPPILIGEPALCARYRRALSRFGIDGAGEVEGTAPAGLFRIATAAGLIEAATEAEP